MFGLDFFDAVLLTGDFQIDELRTLEQLRKLPEKELVVVGSTYMDALDERYKSVEDKSDARDDLTVILAPSWGDSSILNRFGEEFLSALRETGYNIIVRPHPQSQVSEKELLDRLQKKYPDSEKWHWNYDADNFDALYASDILITDFSGVIFDYSFVFDGAIIYADTDLDVSIYDTCWIERPLWRDGIIPLLGRKLQKEDIANIKAVIDETINDEKNREGREKGRREPWMHRGQSAALTADYLIKKLDELKQEG
jgi:CDP-glycerol glycerophosphotransferase (TagB/SpsB family)